MSGVKKRTAVGGTTAIRNGEPQPSSESVLDFLWGVNEDSVTDLKQILKDQIGLPNITAEMRMYFVGKLYEVMKNEASAQGDRRDARGWRKSNDTLPCTRNGRYRETADYVAEEVSLGATTVKRYGLYTKGIDAIRCTDEDSARAILTAKRHVRTNDVISIGMADPETQAYMTGALILGRQINTVKVVSKARRRKNDLNAIAECVSSLFGGTDNEYTAESVMRDIRMNAEPFVNMLAQLISRNAELCRGSKGEIIRTINENVIFRIKEIEEEIERL